MSQNLTTSYVAGDHPYTGCITTRSTCARRTVLPREHARMPFRCTRSHVCDSATLLFSLNHCFHIDLRSVDHEKKNRVPVVHALCGNRLGHDIDDAKERVEQCSQLLHPVGLVAPRLASPANVVSVACRADCSSPCFHDSVENIRLEKNTGLGRNAAEKNFFRSGVFSSSEALSSPFLHLSPQTPHHQIIIIPPTSLTEAKLGSTTQWAPRNRCTRCTVT